MHLLILAGIVLLGFFLRIVNISPFKFYPDAYQSLLVAGNIRNYHSLTGFLGNNGMLYPDFFEWTRPMYPFLIILFQNIFHIRTDAQSAQIVSLVTGLAGILLAYFFIHTVFKSKAAGLSAALIIALSFNHVVWGGFIFTETTGVFFLLLFLYFLFLNLERRVPFANTKDLLSGVLFGFAVLTRYEYIVLIIPVIYLIFRKNPTPSPKLLTMCSSFLVILSLVLSVFFPMEKLVSVFLDQGQGDIPKIVFIVLIAIICIYFLFGFLQRRKIKIVSPRILNLFFIFFLGCSLFYFYPALRQFLLLDMVIVLLSFIGMIILLKTDRVITNFVLLSVVFLIIAYYRVNPSMLRYITHLIPFLLIPIGYLGKRIIERKMGRAIWISIFLLLGYQFYLSFIGMRYRDNGVWFGSNYEELIARQINQKGLIQNSLLLVSLPEPYYFVTGANTYSLIDRYPYVFIDEKLGKKNVVIVQDLGMEDFFPNFSSFLTKNMLSYRIQKIQIESFYHNRDIYIKTKKPVNVYEINVGDLKKKLKEYK